MIQIERDLNPPDPLYHATCEVCGAVRDCGDMEEFDDDVWVCDLNGTDCLEEYYKSARMEE